VVFVFDWLGDLLSPPRCAACSCALGRGKSAFCVPCAASVESCDAGTEPIAFAQYGGAIARAIQRFKYEDRPDLARVLGALLRSACRRRCIGADVVVPVPLHTRRLASRGYNQSALLGHHVARELRAPLAARALVRVIDTVPQVELPREARRANVNGAFRVERATAVAGRSVALVDDVSTTGATLRACRDALIDAGATRVTSVVLARTMPSLLGTSAGDDQGGHG
jgi:ComF family protein